MADRHQEEDRNERLLAALQAVEAIKGSPDIIEALKRAIEDNLREGSN